MRNLKRVLSLALALVMVLGMMVIGTSAATFTDEESITYKEAVEVMSSLGILKGMGDGTFAPKGELTRAQAAKIIAFATMGLAADDYLTGSASVDFSDVAADHWALKYIAYCDNLGIVNGNGDGTFNPDGKLTTVQFAKMLLGALGIDGTYTGAGWEENVKNAVADVDELDATGIKIDNSEITREEACELALAAMKYSPSADVWELKKDGTAIKTYEDPVDAAMAAAALNAGGGATYTVELADADDSLLEKLYNTDFDSDTEDLYGRPAVSYTIGDEDPIFYAATPYKTYLEGFNADEVTALGKAQVTFTGTKFMINGVEANAGDGIEDIDDVAARNYVGTIVELYNTDTDKNIEVVVIVTPYLAKVTDVKTDGEKAENFVKLAVYNLYADGAVKNIEYNANDEAEAEAYEALAAAVAKDDYLIVNYKGGDTDTPKDLIDFAAAESKVVTLTAKKYSAEAFRGTISTAEETFTLASNYAEHNDAGNGVDLGKEYTLYFDANGYVIGSVAVEPEEEEDAEVYYGIVLDADASEYVPANSGDLLTSATEAKDAKELVKILTSEGEVVVYSTNWTYTKNNKGVITGTNFINGSFSGTGESRAYTATIGSGLVAYTLTEDGKIATIDNSGAHTDCASTAGTLEAGKAVMEAFSTFLMTDETIFFVTIDDEDETTDNETVVCTGYKNVPSVDYTGIAYYVDSKVGDQWFFDVLVLTGTEVEGETVDPEVNLVYFGDDQYSIVWDAEANDGEGAEAYLYENVYVNGELVEGGWTVADTLTFTKGHMYEYTVDAEGAISIGDDVTGSTTVTAIMGDYFMAGGVKYVDDTTVYFQIDATKNTITEVEGMPAVKDYNVTIVYVGTPAQNSTITPVVYFTAAEKEA